MPWLVALRDRTPRQAFGWSYLVGLLFFLGSMWWLTKLTAFGGPLALIGWLVLCAYLALYFGAFGYFAHRLLDSGLPGPPRLPAGAGWTLDSGLESRVLGLESRVWSLITIPSLWVALEYLRSHLLSGLGWNLLGYSQTPSLTAIQLANVTGVWGVSFLITMVNVGIAGYVTGQERRRTIPLLLALLAVWGGWAYGKAQLVHQNSGPSLRVAVVQGNIPQDDKWDETRQRPILDQYERLTRQVAAQRPDLIIWPETAVPAFLGLHEAVTARILALNRELGIPLLVGAPTGRFEGPQLLMGNSAILVEDGRLAAQYDKLHLVPFGEFIPGESFAPWLRSVLPPIGEFTPGQHDTVFDVPVASIESRVSSLNPKPETRNPKLRFSTLICFEDVFPELARRFVQQGAQLLVTITNDAWFGDTAAAYQHAQAATFRAVELGVPMIRAANTGWSGCIDAQGRWLTSVHDTHGKELFVEGVATCDVSSAVPSTPYARWGDWFAWLCLLTILAGLLLRRESR